jgi:hypothetical protein
MTGQKIEKCGAVVAFKLFISLSWSPSNWLDINTSAEVDEIPPKHYACLAGSNYDERLSHRRRVLT